MRTLWVYHYFIGFSKELKSIVKSPPDMSANNQNTSLLRKILLAVIAFGPGIFAIGYTIGTGSVTAMIVAGSTYGMQLLWVLSLSCLFSGVLMYVFGNYALISGDTALHGFRRHIKGGKYLALLIILGVGFGQWNSLMGILGISSNIIYELIAKSYPSLQGYQYETVLGIAVVIVAIFYSLMLVGKYTFFEKILIVFVTIMGLSFIISLVFVFPQPADIMLGLVPSIPQVPGGKMMVAAFVGTTMASATFLSRPLFVRGKGWTKANLLDQKKDAIIAAILIFIISGSIMAVACGALFYSGDPVTKVLDMSNTLAPVAGDFAVTLFFFGTLSAGLSSIFPCMLIVPILIADYQKGELDTKSRQFKVITFVASLVALIGPILGSNPIQLQILSQVFNVFVLPAVIIGIIILVNKKSVMHSHTPSVMINVAMGLALFFSLVISYNGVLGLIDFF